MGDHQAGIPLIGRACRLPGAADLNQFWANLIGGVCSIGSIGRDRWSIEPYFHPRPGVAGRAYTFAAGLIEGVFEFDPAVFGISPREATQMDPQQRILLQVVWECLEDAGLPPAILVGRDVGVFVGASSADAVHDKVVDPAQGDAYMMTGNALSLLANRVSYAFDLKGPSFTVDTACSSSLVALDQAVEAIRRGQVELAIVAGVNLLLSPFPFIGFSQARMLSPSGRCRPFDAAGDGYVRSEGAAALILAAPDSKLARHRTTKGRIIATGVNSDGRTVGISLPSSDSQARLIELVHRQAGVDPDAIAFVEAHGTGTRVGDPAEALALGRALASRRDRPLPIGSVKSNIGHLEPASGLAGLLKALLALEHRVLPASLHFETPNPDIAFADLNIAVAAEAVALGSTKSSPYAGVSTFGFGGTNAHVVISGPEAGRRWRPRARAAPSAVPLSAQCMPALRTLARRTAELQPAGEPAVLAAAIAHQRQLQRERAVVLASDRDALVRGCSALATDEPAAHVVRGTALGSDLPLTFVFSGNGAQWAGMGRLAMTHSEPFRARFQAFDALFKALAGWSPLGKLAADDLAEQLASTAVAQPLLFGIQIALVAALAERGVTAASVIGHSVGEVAAAHAAGILPLEAAARVIHARSLHQESMRGKGAMLAVRLGEAEAARLLQSGGFAAIEIAAVNAPGSVTLSGPCAEIEALASRLQREAVIHKRLEIDYPFHSALCGSVKKPLLEDLSDLQPVNGRLPFISTVHGAVLAGRKLDAHYWWQNVRKPVQFAAAVDCAREQGARVFLEVGPRPLLHGYLVECFGIERQRFVAIESLSRDDAPGIDPVSVVAARVLTRGGAVDLKRLCGPAPRTTVPLASYPWQTQAFRSAATHEGFGPQQDDERPHPLLGLRVHDDTPEWRNLIDTHLHPFLADHAIDGTPVLPGAAMVELALAAGRSTLGSERIELRGFDIVQPLFLARDEMVRTRVTVSPETGRIEISSRPRLGEADWQLHAFGQVARTPENTHPFVVEPFADGGMPSGTIDIADIYAEARRHGLDYGPAFRLLQGVKRTGPRSFVAEIAPSSVGPCAWMLDPRSFDAALHALFALYLEFDSKLPLQAFVPVRFDQVRLIQPSGVPARAAIRIQRANERSILADLALESADGACLAVVDGVRLRAASLVTRPDIERLVYRTAWRAVPIRGAQPATEPYMREWCEPADRPGPQAEARLQEEPALLVEAAARRVAYDLVGILARDGAIRLDRAADDRHAALRLAGMLESLAEVGLAERHAEGWHLASACSLPAFADILRTLLAEHPAWSAEATLLARVAALGWQPPDAAAALPFASPILDHLERSSPRARMRCRLLLERLVPLIEHWPQDAPLRVAVLGGGSVTEPLLALVAGRHGSLTVVAAGARALERLRLSLAGSAHAACIDGDAGLEALGRAGPYDLLISGGALHGFADPDGLLQRLSAVLMPGAHVLLAEPEPDAFHDLVMGVSESWYVRSPTPEFPVGRLRSRREWQSVLESCGLAPMTQTAPGPAPALLVARKPTVTALPGDAPALSPQESRVLVIAAGAGAEARFAARLERVLAAAGRHVIRVKPDSAVPIQAEQVHVNGALHFAPGFAESWATLLKTATSDHGVLPDVVLLCGALERSRHRADAAIATRLAMLSALLQALGDRHVQVWLPAPGAVRAEAGRGPAHPQSRALWMAARSAANEHPDAMLRLIDFDARLNLEDCADRLAAAMAQKGPERELLLTGNGALALRLARGRARCDLEAVDSTDAGLTARLAIDRHGALDQLRWHPVGRSAPGPGQVEIAVAAAGLNFRDLMYALGMLPEEAFEDGFSGPGIGFECAGHVSAVGAGVDDLEVGDRVIALAGNAFAGHVTAPAIGVTRLPGGIDLEAAAAVPVAFLTAYYALHELARLQAGEWVLIHGGAGALGLAALQITQWKGARAIVTAGNEEKRELLRLLGAEHVLSSRSLAFADGVRRLTGDGVDVVLNTLSGEAMELSLDLVKPFGRFLELGKRDYYANTRLGLRPFRRNVSYFGIDADQLLARQPERSKRLLAEVVRHFADGTFAPLPYRVFEAGQAVEAFRLMQQSGHIGKIVIRPPSAVRGGSAAPRSVRFDPNGLAVIAGCGGFGLAAARWLAERGARRIVLASRSGRATSDGEKTLGELRRDGVTVTIQACDVADRKDLADLLDRLRAQGPIRTVVHAAMVLDDAPLRELDGKRMLNVLRPKVLGASHLDRLTRDDPIEHFLLFTSIAAVIGNPGQAVYAAANGYLEGLAAARREAGLPALAIAWGAITDTGYLARQAGSVEVLARRAGAERFAARHALGLLDTLMRCDGGGVAEAVQVLAPMNWSKARQALPLFESPAFSHLAREADETQPSDAGRIDLAAAVSELDPAAAHALVVRLVTTEVASIFRMPEADINPARPLTELGMDSLMGLELRMKAQRSLGVDIPLVSVGGGLSIDAIASKIIARLGRAETAAGLLQSDAVLATRHVSLEGMDTDALQRIAETVEERRAGMERVL